MQRSRLRSFLERLEPWLCLIAIVGILFLPGDKTPFWLVLVLLALVTAIRKWKEGWRFFSLDSMGETMRAALLVPGVLLAMFFAHEWFPGFVHGTPDTSHFAQRYRWTVDLALPGHEEAHGLPMSLTLERKRSRILIDGKVTDEHGRAVFVFDATASWGDYVRAAVDGFHDGLPVDMGEGRATGLPRRFHAGGRLQLSEDGRPLRLRLVGAGQGFRLEG
ncbi:MAG: hypothetical protein R3F30_15685 [Planctomycetota bacterium]